MLISYMHNFYTEIQYTKQTMCPQRNLQMEPAENPPNDWIKIQLLLEKVVLGLPWCLFASVWQRSRHRWETPVLPRII